MFFHNSKFKDTTQHLISNCLIDIIQFSILFFIAIHLEMWIEWIENVYSLSIRFLFHSFIHSLTFIQDIYFIGDKLCEKLCAHDDGPLMIMNENLLYVGIRILWVSNELFMFWKYDEPIILICVIVSHLFSFRGSSNRIWETTKGKKKES